MQPTTRDEIFSLPEYRSVNAAAFITSNDDEYPGERYRSFRDAAGIAYEVCERRMLYRRTAGSTFGDGSVFLSWMPLDD